jgi:hypothetical protein
VSISSNKLKISIEKQLKGAKKHILRIVFTELLLVLIAIYNGLFTSGNNVQTIIVTIIFFLSFLYSVYLVNKYYKKTLNSIEYVDYQYYLITYSKWFSSNHSTQVSSEKIKISINKIDPNSGTSAFSSITFYDQNKSYKFEIVLEDLRDILIFFWNNKTYSLTMSEIWDIREIGNYKGFEELKTIF